MPATCQRVENKLREVKTILRSLLISKGSRDVTVRQLNNLYREMEDSNIPFKSFNYASLIDFLQSMPDTLRLLNSRTGELCVYHVDTEKSAHVSSLVARQKKTVGRKTRSGSNIRSANFPAYNYSKPAPTHNQIPDNELLKILQQLRESVTSNSSQNFGIRKVDVLTKIKEKFDRLGKFDNTYTIQNLNRQLYQFTHLLVIENDYIYFNNEFSNRKKNINHKPEPRKPVISNNSKLYTVPQTENNISQNCNNNDTDQNSKSILNNSNCSKAPQTESNLFQNCNDDVEEKSNSIIENITNEIVKGRTRIRLENLIKNHPEGIWCSELPTIYKKEFGVHLEYNELGFNNITEFVAALPDIFVIVEPPNTKKQMVLDAKANNGLENLRQTKTLASLYNIEDYTACDPEPVPIKLSSSVSQALIPEGVMNLNEIIDQVLVTSLISEEYVEVIVSEVFNPSFFWITLRKNKKKIRALMSELGEFYMDQDLDVYKIPQVVLGVGLHVACLYNNLWHRGVIKKIKPDGFVIVFFNDYGTVKTYNPNELYFLNKRFSSLPGQAIPCGLYNIRPIESSEWTTESTDAFVTKVWNVPLIAIISNIDEENNSMMVTLTDTSDDITDLHINDWMVENNWAEWGKMVCIKNKFFFQHCQQNLRKNGCNLSLVLEKKEAAENTALYAPSSSSENYVCNKKKVAALREYKEHSSSNQSSSFDEIVYVYPDMSEKKDNYNQKLFNRYKELLVIEVEDSKNTTNLEINKKTGYKAVQHDCDKSVEDMKSLVSSLTLDLTNEGISKCITKFNNVVDKNDKDPSSKHSEANYLSSTDVHHPQIKTINQSSKANKSESSLRYDSLFNRLKSLGN